MIEMSKISQGLVAAFGAILLTATAVGASVGPVRTSSGVAAPAALAALLLSSQA
jgi:hypothetical protein